MAERRGHPWAAAFISLITPAVVGFGGVVWAAMMAVTEGSSGNPLTAGDIAPGVVVLAVVLVGGLWAVWREGSGGWGRRRRVWAPTHQVPAGGMKVWKGLRDNSGESIDLPEHLPLRLDEVMGTWARVSGSHGASGWPGC